MEKIVEIWKEQIVHNPIDGISFEICLARRMNDNVISYELPGEKFNEILSDLALLKIWTQWRSSHCVKYYLKDMAMVLQELGDITVSLNRTTYHKYLSLDDALNNTNTNTGAPHDEETSDKMLENADSFLSILPTNRDIFVHHEIKTEPPEKPDVSSSLHLKCVRKIPLSHNAFPPTDKYHAIERIAFRFYDHLDFSVYFQITRPSECSKKFEELLVNWQGSKFSIRIIVKNPKSEAFRSLLGYLGWSRD